MKIFEPRGKVATLIDAMRAAPDRAVWSAAEVAQCMDVSQGNLPAYLRAVLDHGHVFRKLEGGKSYFSLQPFGDEPQAECAQPQALQIPTLRQPGEWKPPVMTPPRGATGYVARSPLPEPLHTIIAAPTPPPLPATTEPEPEPEVQDEPESAAAPEFEAALWHDGDLVLYGLEEMVDGGYRVPARSVDCLRWMLGGRAP